MFTQCVRLQVGRGKKSKKASVSRLESISVIHCSAQSIECCFDSTVFGWFHSDGQKDHWNIGGLLYPCFYDLSIILIHFMDGKFILNVIGWVVGERCVFSLISSVNDLQLLSDRVESNTLANRSFKFDAFGFDVGILLHSLKNVCNETGFHDVIGVWSIVRYRSFKSSDIVDQHTVFQLKM